MPTANRMRRFTRLVPAILAAVSVACGQSISPIGPAATEGSLRRIVGDISGGNVGPPCVTPPFCPLPEAEGEVAVTSNAGTLTTAYPAGFGSVVFAADPRTFKVTAFSMSATGRLAERGLAEFVMDVAPETAAVSIYLGAANDAYFLATGTATPTFSVTSDASCASGQRLQTTLALHLPFLGQTEIVDTHCIK